MLFERVQSTLERNCLLDHDRPVLTGVSGGPDSLYLMDILHKLGYPIIVAHLDHGLRPGSENEQNQLARIAARYSLPFIAGREDVAEYARVNQQSVEEAARNVRYRFLFEQAENQQAQAVAVGHNADDQVETVLMHLLRGAGLAGLRGMEFRSLPSAWSSAIPLVRPLLGVWRAEILAALSSSDLQPIQDPSNLDTRYYRNRLRHEAIPYLDQLTPGVRQRLWQMADILREENELVNQSEEAAWLTCCHYLGEKQVALDRETFNQQPRAIQRRLIRRGIASLRPGLRNIDFETIERALAFIKEPSRTGQIDLAAGLRMEQEGKTTWLAVWGAALPALDWPQIEKTEWMEISPPVELQLGCGWQLRAEVLPVSGDARQFDPWEAWLDLDRISLPLGLRSRRSGDRFRPLGMEGHSLKLSDYLINVQMPRRARAGWPLLISGAEIAWTPGYTINQLFALHPGSRQSIHLSLKNERRDHSGGPALS